MQLSHSASFHSRFLSLNILPSPSSSIVTYFSCLSMSVSGLPPRFTYSSPRVQGRCFTFTPAQGWSSSTNSAATLQLPSTSSSSPSSSSTSSKPLLFPHSSSLSISPTLGFDIDSSTPTLPAMISPRAHIHLTRSSSAPSDLSPSSSSARKRRRPSIPSIDSEDEEEEEEGRNAEDIQSLEGEEDDVDEELCHINRQPLSILISPLVCKERPHCPVPLSPSTASLSSSSPSRLSAPSPRRPLFVNQLLTMGTASALIITPSASTASSLTSTSSAFSFPHPAPHDALTSISRALSTDPILQRTRSAWRREYEGRAMEGRCMTRPVLPLRRIVPRHVGPDMHLREEEQVGGEEGKEIRKWAEKGEATACLPSVRRMISSDSGNKKISCEAPSNKRRLLGGGRKRVGVEQSLIVDFFTSKTRQRGRAQR